MDTSNATELIAVTAGLAHGFKPLIEEGAKLLDLALAGPAQALGDSWKARLREIDFIKRITAAGKAKRALDAHGIHIRNVPPEFMLPMLNAAADSAAEEVHDLLANLLASGTAKDFYQHPLFRHAATQLNADEAKLIDSWAPGKKLVLYALNGPAGTTSPLIHDQEAVELASSESIGFYIENLTRLGLCNPFMYESIQLADIPVSVQEHRLFKKGLAKFDEQKQPHKFYKADVFQTAAGIHLSYVSALRPLKPVSDDDDSFPITSAARVTVIIGLDKTDD